MVLILDSIKRLMARGRLDSSSLPESIIDQIAEDDPSIPSPDRERKLRKRREEEFNNGQQEEKKRADAERKDADTAALIMESWLASNEYRRAIAELSGNITDARKAAHHAYERALQTEEQAREAFENARSNAIVLADGRRVYFTRDGTRLYGEDDREITDGIALAEARSRHAEKSNATSREEFEARRTVRNEAKERVEHLQATLSRLDDLDARIKSGRLSREEIAQAQHELRETVDSMPAEAREEYDRLQAARKGDRTLNHRETDPAFDKAPDVNGEFHKAHAAAAKAIGNPDPLPADIGSRKVSAVVAPDF